MLQAIWIKLAPNIVRRNVDQLKICRVSQAITPPSMTGTKVACKNGTRMALSHNPTNGGFFISTVGPDISRIEKLDFPGGDISLIP